MQIEVYFHTIFLLLVIGKSYNTYFSMMGYKNIKISIDNSFLKQYNKNIKRQWGRRNGVSATFFVFSIGTRIVRHQRCGCQLYLDILGKGAVFLWRTLRGHTAPLSLTGENNGRSNTNFWRKRF